MFLGQFYHTIDEKGRLTMPARFREILVADGAFVMRGFDQNLMVLTAESFTLIYQRINQMSMTDPGARLLRRLIYSYAAPVEFDKTGRMLIPPFLREAAGIQSDVIIVGTGDYLEIWSPELWQMQDSQLGDVNVTASRFAALDLATKPVD